jgi:hypothetical protein
MMVVMKMYSSENSKYSTGNSAVDKIGKMNISGNVIPASWYKTIVNKNGKPNLNAIVILADIIYWYRPTEIRDEATGQVIGMKKKFKSDKLQRSYGQFGNQFGLSKQQVTDAIIFLEKLGVIRREFRNMVLNGQKCVNLLFIDINPQILYKITYPENDTVTGEISISALKGRGVGFETDTLSALNKGGIVTEKDTLSVSIGRGIGLNMDTNTYNTKEINNRDYIYSINQSINNTKESEIDRIDRYKEIIKDNIGYETLLAPEYKNSENIVNEIVELITEMVVINKHTVRINGNDVPSEIVKSRFMKLDYSDVAYVLEAMDKKTTKVINIRAYLLTALYNSKTTIHNYYDAEVKHDFYGTKKVENH